MFSKKGVLKNFAKFTEKHLARATFLIKLQVKKELKEETVFCSFLSCWIFTLHHKIREEWKNNALVSFLLLSVCIQVFNSFMTEVTITFCANQWIGFYMIGTSVMKEVTVTRCSYSYLSIINSWPKNSLCGSQLWNCSTKICVISSFP